MPLDGNFFTRIKTKSLFLEEVHQIIYDSGLEMGVETFWNKGRALEAFFHWTSDLESIPARNETIDNPCHLKCAAFLIYWLRRFSPIEEFAYDEASASYEKDQVEFMLKYGREYLAFDIGYRAAQVYERGINERNLPGGAFSLSSSLEDVKDNDFVMTVVQVLKSKNVSPHSIFLTLKAIFLRP